MSRACHNLNYCNHQGRQHHLPPLRARFQCLLLTWLFLRQSHLRDRPVPAPPPPLPHAAGPAFATVAFGGICVGLVIKHAGGVRKGFAIIVGILLTGIVEALLVGRLPSAATTAALPIVLVSTWVHIQYPVRVHQLPRPAHTGLARRGPTQPASTATSHAFWLPPHTHTHTRARAHAVTRAHAYARIQTGGDSFCDPLLTTARAHFLPAYPGRFSQYRPGTGKAAEKKDK